MEENTVNEEVKNKIIVRDLLAPDVWTIAAMAHKINFKDKYKKFISVQRELNKELKEIDKEGKTEGDIKKIEDETVENYAGDLFSLIIDSIPFVKDEVTEFFASLIGVSIEEYNKMPIHTPIEIINQLVKKPGISDFFKLALR